MQFTTVRSKEKDYDIYLKSKKQPEGARKKCFPAICKWKKLVPMVHSQQENEKNVSQLFASGKKWFLAISSLTNTFAAIQRYKNVDPCYMELKKCSSQLLGARKKIMTSI